LGAGFPRDEDEVEVAEKIGVSRIAVLGDEVVSSPLVIEKGSVGKSTVPVGKTEAETGAVGANALASALH
jgi:hypothetical protein